LYSAARGGHDRCPHTPSSRSPSASTPRQQQQTGSSSPSPLCTGYTGLATLSVNASDRSLNDFGQLAFRLVTFGRLARCPSLTANPRRTVRSANLRPSHLENLRDIT